MQCVRYQCSPLHPRCIRRLSSINHRCIRLQIRRCYDDSETTIERSTTASTASTSSINSMDDDGAQKDAVRWWDKPLGMGRGVCLWKTIDTIDQLEALLASSTKPVAVDFFAGWCSSCKSSFPALCKIPLDPELKDKFVWAKVNIEEEENQQFVRKLSAGGIPYMAVFAPGGRHLVGMTASFKRMAQVKANLVIIASQPDAKRFVLNPQGVAEPA